MSLARTALRLQSVVTLLAEPVIDALCEGRVYDSRISDFDHREPVPTIVITTEEDDAKAWSANNGGAPFNHVCDLVLEIAMTVVAGTDAENLPTSLGTPATDSELEAYLDLIEEAAVDALTVGETPQARLLRKAVTRRVPKLKSSRFSTDQTGERLAIRLVTLTVELKGEDQRDVTVAITGRYASLPDPLRTVATALPEGFSGRITCDLLASKLARPGDDAFRGADLTLAPTDLDPASAPDPEESAGAGSELVDLVVIPAWTP